MSEPLFLDAAYYPEPKYSLSGGSVEWYGNPTASPPVYFSAPLLLETKQAAGGDPQAGSRPIVQDSTGANNLLQTGTTINYKTIFLQRLASPQMPWDPVTNPYLTVDWLPVDLSVFNGDDRRPTTWPPDTWMNYPDGTRAGATAVYQPWDADDPMNSTAHGDDPNYNKNRKLVFASRQRGGNNLFASGAVPMPPGSANLWSQAVANPFDPTNTYNATNDPTNPTDPSGMTTSSSVASIPANNFSYDLNNTLGYLNVAFSSSGVITGGTYMGSPATPFPLVAWNNRPYANAMELLMVPSSDPRRLLWEFQFLPSSGAPPYTTSAGGGVGYPNTGGIGVPYPYLLNFFHSSAGSASGVAPQLYRILEYVGVPSPFVQSETFINPSTASTGAAGLHNFHPPFNRISKYREPGKINLNTIYSADVLDGLMNYFPGMTSGTGFWNKFVASRGGLSQTGTSQFSISSTCPTRFANPFRSFAGGDMVPAVPGMTPPGLALPREIEATLLRSDPAYPGVRPLFQYDTIIPGTPGVANYNDPNRNPYFRYQALTRLGNLVTTRSNVYAFWITVGYFEVTPWTNNVVNGPTVIDAGHPDGYQLGPELGSDTGEVERHRAFYIFDRTIPVGFQRGQDLNIEKGLLLRRYIE